MARLNWQKVVDNNKRQSAIQAQRDSGQRYRDIVMLLSKGIWMIGSAHKGKRMKDLPTQYLCWYTDKAEKEQANKQPTLAYRLAEQELRRRYSSLKVSGPDSNTAVEKPA